MLLRLNLAEALRENGYTVLEAANAIEAMTLIDVGPDVGLVFSDIQMPRAGEGIDLALWLAERHPQTMVALTSASETALIEARRRCSRAVAFILKPYRLEDVISQIRVLLSKCETN